MSTVEHRRDTLVGTSIPRREDKRILTGQGHYVDDVHPRGLLHAHFLRSPHPHARILRITTDAARAHPGVTTVLTAADLADSVNLLNFAIPIDGLTTPTYSALAADVVRYVGDPVVLIVARTRSVAEDAAELVEIQYEPLASVRHIDAAVAEGAPQLHDAVQSNTTFTNEMSNGDVDGAFARAHRIVRDELQLHRWAPTPMETRGGVADYDSATRVLSYTVACQSPHLMRFVVSTALGHPLHLLRVLGPDVGGSFGLKWSPYREDVLVCAAARLLGAPVKWIEDRCENLVAGGHGRDHRVGLEIAVAEDGEILAMRADIVVNTGAYPAMPSAAVTCGLIRTALPGPYRVTAFAARSRVVVTNTAPHVSLRGPWAIETLARERALDLVARELGLSPVAVRERNLLTAEEQPAEIASGHVVDGVTARATFERALELVDLPELERTLSAARADGRVVGFGLATSFEPAPATPSFFAAVGFPFDGEVARVRMEPDGTISVFTAQMPHGQGHETTLSQLVGDVVGVPIESIRIMAGNTDFSPFNMVGTGGSRAATFANGSAVLAARGLRDKIIAIAAKMLQADPDNMVVIDGGAQVGTDEAARVGFADLAMGCYMAPSVMPEGVDLTLECSATYDGEGGGFSQSTHCCWIEIDAGTGQIEILRYLVVEDCGVMINPAIVEGQIRGATAMGLGGMLLEHVVYDDAGNCRTQNFFDYLVATAVEIPDIQIEHLETPSALTMGARGVGEGGAIVAPAALTNAIDDALMAAVGRRADKTPFTQTHILEALGTITPAEE